MGWPSGPSLVRIDDEITSRLGSIKRIQQGTIGVSLAVSFSATATITAVDTNKAFVMLLGWTGASGVTGNARVELTNATTVTATVTGMLVSGGNSAGDTTVSITVGYVVVEFN